MDWKVKENSNMSYSLQGLNNYISSDITAEYWLNKIYPPTVRDAHYNGDIHLHDLSLLSVYCVGWDLQDLLLEGFKGVAGKVESSPPRHFRSALGQIVNFFYTLQGEAAGAQAMSNFDTLLAPFVREDKLSTKEVKQALQEFVFNINIPTRWVPDPVHQYHHGSERTGHSCGLPGHHRRQIPGRHLCRVSKRDGHDQCRLCRSHDGRRCQGRVFTFPIPTYNITRDFDWNNPNLENIWKMTGKYGIPYFSNFVNSDMSPEDARSMCCRLRLDNRELRKRGGGLFGANPLTGSIGVVTLNLPRIGFLAEDEPDFFKRLDHLTRLAAESLSIKRKILEKFTHGELYPYSKFYLRKIKESTGVYWRNHFSTIGILGMNEACINFMNQGIATPDGQAFAVRVMDHLRNVIEQLQAETDEIFNLEATPAEGTTYRFASLDKNGFQTSSAPMKRNSNRAVIRFTPIPPICRSTTRMICSRPWNFRTRSRPNTPAGRSSTCFWERRSATPAWSSNW